MRGWKEVGLVKPGHVLVFRMRWTKVDYDEKVDGKNYFHAPEHHLLEYPGYVYHCHFLHHEDNMLMRPIML